jgi:GT2 family glycosyltransferase
VPEPTIIIVTYNAETDIEACLRSLSGWNVVVVDNYSQDGTTELLARISLEQPSMRTILNDENVGFAAAVNQALRAVPEGDVLLLNPDASIDSPSLDLLRESAAAPGVGIVAPIIDNGPTVAVLAAGAQPRIWPLFTHYSGLSRMLPRLGLVRGRHLYRPALRPGLTPVEWVSGGCLYLSEEVRTQVPELTERWFMYGEDLDLCRRVTEAGYSVNLVAGAHAVHAVGASVNASGGPVSTMWARNTYDYYCVTYRPGPLRRFVWRAIFSVGLWSRAAAFDLMARRPGRQDSDLRDRAKRFRRHGLAVWVTAPLRS